MRQILYVSSSRPDGAKSNVSGILEQSRHNNAIDGVTGLLWTDGVRFLQVIEGPDDSVAQTFERIKADRRHHAIVVLIDRAIDSREFGDWTMAHRHAGDDADALDERMRHLLADASETIKGNFLGLIAARRRS